MLIAERVLLIACEPLSGEFLWPRAQPSAQLIVAAAVACELVTMGRLVLRDGLFRTDTQIPTSHPLLNATLQQLSHGRFDPAALLRAIANRMDPIVTRILDGLFRRDILHRTSKRDWLLRKHLRYPVRSMQARNEAVAALHGAAAGGEDLNALALLVLSEASGLMEKTLNSSEIDGARKRILVLNNVTSQSSEPLRGLANIRSALLS
ncbi:MAG: GPP34 family phosphoprotein [Rudaea sp.]